MDKKIFEKAKDLLSLIRYLEDKRKKAKVIRRCSNYGVEFGFNDTIIGNFDAEDVYFFCDYLIDKYSKQIDKLKKEFEEL